MFWRVGVYLMVGYNEVLCIYNIIVLYIAHFSLNRHVHNVVGQQSYTAS